jgi:hypothetical protein
MDKEKEKEYGIEGKPQRDSQFWKAFTCLKESGLNQEGN